MDSSKHVASEQKQNHAENSGVLAHSQINESLGKDTQSIKNEERLIRVYDEEISRKVTTARLLNNQGIKPALSRIESQAFSITQIKKLSAQNRTRAIAHHLFDALYTLHTEHADIFTSMIAESGVSAYSLAELWFEKNDQAIMSNSDVDALREDFKSYHVEQPHEAGVENFNRVEVLHRIAHIQLVIKYPENLALQEANPSNVTRALLKGTLTKKEKLTELAEGLLEHYEDEDLLAMLDGISKLVVEKRYSQNLMAGRYQLPKGNRFSFVLPEGTDWKIGSSQVAEQLDQLFAGPKRKQILLGRGVKVMHMLLKRAPSIGRNRGNTFYDSTVFKFKGDDSSKMIAAARNYGLNQIHYAWTQSGSLPNPAPHLAMSLGLTPRLLPDGKLLIVKGRTLRFGPYTENSTFVTTKQLAYVAAFLQYIRKGCNSLVTES